MRWTVTRLILLRLVPGRLLPILTIWEVVRLLRQVRRLWRGARQRAGGAAPDVAPEPSDD